MAYEFQVGATVVDATPRKRLKFDDDEAYRDAVNEMGAGLRVTVTISDEVEHRSKTWEQVKYWWAVPVPLVAEHCGMTDRQASHAMLGECFGYTAGPFGKPVPVEPSLADLSVEKMKHLIDWVQDWGPAELETIIPPPDKDWRKNAEIIRRQRRVA